MGFLNFLEGVVNSFDTNLTEEDEKDSEMSEEMKKKIEKAKERYSDFGDQQLLKKYDNNNQWEKEGWVTRSEAEANRKAIASILKNRGYRKGRDGEWRR